MQKTTCCRHQLNPLSLIKFTSQKAQLWCEECLIEQEENNGKIQMKNIISVNKALEQPDYLISRLNISGENTEKLKGYQQKQKSVLEKQIKDLEFQMEELKKQFQSILNDINEKMKKIIQIRQQFQIELQNIIKYEEFQQIINDMNQLESNINPDTVQQIEQRLFKYLSNIQQNDSSQLNQQLSKFMNNFYFNINKEIGQFVDQNKIIQLNQNLLNQYTIIMKNMGYYYNSLSSDLVDNKFDQKLQFIMRERTKKEIKKYELIYKGPSQILNFSEYWQKVEGKSNLLLIFQYSNKQVFGFYTPHKLGKYNNRNSYKITNETNTMFLFSQTHDEIFPTKDHQYGQMIGNLVKTNDELVFDEQSSRIYIKWDQFQGITQNHTKGLENAYVVQLEIYQVIFQ